MCHDVKIPRHDNSAIGKFKEDINNVGEKEINIRRKKELKRT